MSPRATVALETALLSLGLPYPQNVEVFLEMAAAVEEAGAHPVGIAIHAGRVRIGLDDALIEHMATSRDVKKCARRDIGWVLAGGHTGATTVSSTLWLAHRAGIRVFATGGIGGVHPMHSGPADVSADLPTMGEVPMVLVSAGTKSICDPVATAEMLETYSVPVLGYRTDRFPHFYAGPSVVAVPRIETPADAVDAYVAHLANGGTATTLIANPAPEAHRLDPAVLEKLTRAGMGKATAQRIAGNALTPFLLDHLARGTRGRSVEANRALLVSNARLAGQIAVEVTSRPSPESGTAKASASRRSRR